MMTAKPSEMDKGTFAAEFGGVFEHSVWVVEGAHAPELGPTHDTAIGVLQMLAWVFRNADAKKRLAVLNVPRGLTGKLAAAKRLTVEARAEQASVGLDEMTDDERQAFLALNDSRTAKFGFPFIIAVRGNTIASIIEAFQRSIGQEHSVEFAAACNRVKRIVQRRIIGKLPA